MLKMIRLRYGNTNTFFIPGNNGGLLVDTDYAGTLSAFYKALKNSGLTVKDISRVLATHYHPDHMGLIGELMKQGVKLLLVDVQKDFVHFSDRIFERDKLPYIPIDETTAVMISCTESRKYLERLGISAEIIHTPSHSDDSISLLLDNGDSFVGDLEPFEYLGAYEENLKLEWDWEHILSFRPKRIFYAHVPEMIVE
jgi:glyoxylase-like metal-dependent hydrolase (beta-lactamase superfamily II)